MPLSDIGHALLKEGKISSKEGFGLTKREHFAAMAMQGLLANSKQSKYKSNIFIRFVALFFPKTNITWCSSNHDDLAKDAISHADEILHQLEKTESE